MTKTRSCPQICRELGKIPIPKLLKSQSSKKGDLGKGNSGSGQDFLSTLGDGFCLHGSFLSWGSWIPGLFLMGDSTREQDLGGKGIPCRNAPMEWQMRDGGCGIFPGVISKPLSLREGFASRDSASGISGIRERQQLETRRALWCQNLGSKISPSLFKRKKK